MIIIVAKINKIVGNAKSKRRFLKINLPAEHVAA